jgi:hypothetical protein
MVDVSNENPRLSLDFLLFAATLLSDNSDGTEPNEKLGKDLLSASVCPSALVAILLAVVVVVVAVLDKPNGNPLVVPSLAGAFTGVVVVESVFGVGVN